MRKIKVVLPIFVLLFSALPMGTLSTEHELIPIESENLINRIYDELTTKPYVFLEENGSIIAMVANSSLVDITILNYYLTQGRTVILVGNECEKIYELSKSPNTKIINKPITLSAIRILQDVEETFVSMGDETLKDAIEWAEGLTSAESTYSSSTYSINDFPLPQQELILDKREYIYCDYKPYGKLNLILEWFTTPAPDAHPYYSFWGLKMICQTIPGIAIDDDAYDHSWKTADFRNLIDLDYFGDANLLTDYAPTTTVGETTVTYTVGVNVPMPPPPEHFTPTYTFTKSASYSIADVLVYDQSDFSQQKAKWWHDINEDKPVGQNAYKMIPGITFEVTTESCSKIYHWYEVVFLHLIFFIWPETVSCSVECITEFQWQHKVEISSSYRGTTTPTGTLFIRAGETLIVEAHPEPQFRIWCWAVNDKYVYGDPLRLKVNRPYTIRPVFIQIAYQGHGGGGGGGA